MLQRDRAVAEAFELEKREEKVPFPILSNRFCSRFSVCCPGLCLTALDKLVKGKDKLVIPFHYLRSLKILSYPVRAPKHVVGIFCQGPPVMPVKLQSLVHVCFMGCTSINSQTPSSPNA